MEVGGIPPRRKDERDYDREMNRLYLRPYLTGVAAAIREARPDSTSAWLATIAAYTATFEREMAVRFPREAVARWAARVNSYHADRFIRSFARAGKVDITPWMNHENTRVHLIDVIQRNIDLITDLPRGFNTRIAESLERAERAAPMDMAARERIFRKEGKFTGYRLRLITRDQTNKLNGELSRIRQTDAGIDAYKWSTSQDERVRPTHVDKNGRVFSWGHAPPDTGHPGNDIQCRCVAVAHITLEQIEQKFGA